MTLIALQQTIILFTMAVNTAVGVYVLYKNPKNIVHQTFTLFILGTALWGSGIVLLSMTQNFFFNQVIFFGGTLFPLALFIFAKVFPSAKSIPKAFLLLLAPFVPLFLAIPFDVFVSDVIIHPSGHLEPIQGTFFPVYIFTILSYLIASLILFAKKYIGSRGKERARMRYLFLGLGIFLTSTIVFDAILPALHITQFNLLGPLSSLVFVGLTAYAIVRHQLLDIRVVIQRGLIYTLLLSLILGAYVSILLIIERFIKALIGFAPIISAGLVMIVGIVTIPALISYFRKKTDPFFFKGHYELTDAVESTNRAIQDQTDVHKFSRNMSDSIAEALKPEFIDFVDLRTNMRFENDNLPINALEEYGTVALNLIAKQQTLLHVPLSLTSSNEHTRLLATLARNRSVTIIVPLVAHGETMAVLCLGKKKSGDAYTETDIRLLESIAYHAAAALENIHLHEQERRHAEELENKVHEQTKDIRRIQEEQKQSMLDISHGLQTPLTVLRGKVELLSENPSRKERQEVIKTVDEVSHLAYELMALSRLNTPLTVEEKQEVVTLSDTLSDLMKDLQSVAEKEGILFTYYIEPNVSVYGISDDLRNLAMNIIGNAIKYTAIADEPKEIEVSLTKVDNSAVFTVKDTGIGISESALPHIFETFYRERFDSQSRGAGIGLAISKKIVENHNGSINIQSNLGEGTTCVITIPTTQ